MRMTVKTYASFEMLLELDTEDADEAEREALEWIGENAGELTEENVEIIQVPAPGGTEPRALKIGDRVTAPLDGGREPGTVVSLFPLDRDGPEAFVRFDSGALRALILDALELSG
ncbi:hypothetical protein AKJ57_02920 [candidate division MSBL1 archaeon SCGC-AAA259A05]|uniref:Uncharacterized protein n=1 Tax=candidate division MSBL1 archaeon SCGC-AAA259A05 TaxID=1698259 RepID=A0A133U9Y6_9EURY|nr:hypothetical protein AKJ57_02920 [candidate division MSBL1 archaeon SCGC-AAA259A05]